MSHLSEMDTRILPAVSLLSQGFGEDNVRSNTATALNSLEEKTLLDIKALYCLLLSPAVWDPVFLGYLSDTC